VYNGVKVPLVFCCCSENGSITAELLAARLVTIDGLGVLIEVTARLISCYSMGATAGLIQLSSNTSMIQWQNGMFEFGCRTAPAVDKMMATAQNRMNEVRWH
jgi:hypothetical protein